MAWKAAILEAPGRASRTNADCRGRRLNGNAWLMVERAMVEAMRLVGAALHACRSSAGRTAEAIAIEAECVVVREAKLSVEGGMEDNGLG